MTARLPFYGLLAACVGFAALIFWELQPGRAGDPAPPRVANAPVAPAPVARRPPATPPEELVGAILARPLFSATRRPPPATGSDAGANDDLNNARLTGIVTAPGRRIALFAVPGPKTLLLSDGGVVGGWRIEDISPTEVSLDGPGGIKKLQPKIDPNRPIPASPPPLLGGPAAAQPAAGFGMPPRPGAAPGAVVQTPFRPTLQPGQR